MITLAQKICLHFDLANKARDRARAAHKAFAKGLGKTKLPVINVMTGCEESYWLVPAAGDVVPLSRPEYTIGALNLRVFDFSGELDQPLIEVGDHA